MEAGSGLGMAPGVRARAGLLESRADRTRKPGPSWIDTGWTADYLALGHDDRLHLPEMRGVLRAGRPGPARRDREAGVPPLRRQGPDEPDGGLRVRAVGDARPGRRA